MTFSEEILRALDQGFGPMHWAEIRRRIESMRPRKRFLFWTYTDVVSFNLTHELNNLVRSGDLIMIRCNAGVEAYQRKEKSFL